MQFIRSTFAVTPLLGLLALAGPTSGCDSAPANPTYISDVQPLLEANCVRCHSYPARGGAPTSFRLDVYDSVVMMDGTEIRGAEVMAEYIRQRAGVEGTMPPDFARGDVLRDTLKNWFVSIRELPSRGGHSSNGDPVAVLLGELPATVDKDTVEVTYEVSDGDGDIVHGRFTVNGVEVADGLHSGRGSFHFDTGSLPEGDHDIVAEMSDGRGPTGKNGRGFITNYPVKRVLGTLQVRHADGNTAPTFTLFRKFASPAVDFASLQNPGTQVVGFFNHTMLADAQSPAIVHISVDDIDAADTHRASLVAFRGDEEVVVESQIDIPGGTIDYLWDTTVMPEGPGWRLRAVVTDSRGASTTLETGTVHFSHHTTSETFSTILEVLNDNCGACHYPNPQKEIGDLQPYEEPQPSAGLIPYLGLTFVGQVPTTTLMDGETDPSLLRPHLVFAELHRKVGYNSGNMYKRVVEEENMPPSSALGLGRLGRVLSDEDRARLADYLLGGAPK